MANEYPPMCGSCGGYHCGPCLKGLAAYGSGQQPEAPAPAAPAELAAKYAAVVEAAREWKAARADYCAYSYEHTHGQPDQRRCYEVRDRLRAANAQLEAALAELDGVK